jgi:branched-chain amino acid transport system permease protein
MAFFFEVLIGGLLSGVMYGLVALGFVLIYKASGVFNFAQGAMVFFGALTVAGLKQLGVPLGFAIAVVAALVIVLAVMIERMVLRPLLAQPSISVFMATLGLSFVIDGLVQAFWGNSPRALELGIPDVPLEWLLDTTGIGVSTFDLIASMIALALICVLSVFFSYTKTGRALRAVADDTTAALSIGIPLQRVLIVVWSAAGLIALVAGLLWGARNGVQYSLTLVALKAFPVLIIGGFGSIPGAFLGGLIVGASEKLADVFIGPMIGGGIESWFPYVLALLFLLVRPEGIFGDRIIRRV